MTTAPFSLTPLSQGEGPKPAPEPKESKRREKVTLEWKFKHGGDTVKIWYEPARKQIYLHAVGHTGTGEVSLEKLLDEYFQQERLNLK